MRFLLMTDIEGVTGVTTYFQAEKSQLGRDMLMNDLLAVIEGIRSVEHHEIVLYDMHTDGRNIDMTQLPEDVTVVMGKPINGKLYRGVGGDFDGLFMIGLHAMSREPNALLAHSYLVEYDSINLNGELVGEIGMERALAGEQGFPLVFVSGDDKGCAEAKAQDPNIVTAVVKKSLGDSQALCITPAQSRILLKEAAAKAVALVSQSEEALSAELQSGILQPKVTELPVTIRIQYSDCRYLEIMKELHPEIFINENTVEIKGDGLLECWSEYLLMEREMVTTCAS